VCDVRSVIGKEHPLSADPRSAIRVTRPLARTDPMIRRSRAGQLHRSIETLLEMQRPRNLEHACNVMMPAKGRPHGQRRADEVAVNEIWLDGIDQIDQCSRQCGNTPRGADREIEIRNVDRYTSGL